MLDMIGSYDEAWKAIISPARQDYNISDLGPAEFAVKDNRIKRTDFRLLNNRGHVIECSFFEHINIQTPIPCVVYLHGNGCSRIEAMNYLDTVLSQPISFFCFDFSGCGKSDGLYTSIGWHEQDDLNCIIQYLFNSQKVSKIAVWGRSMGAITALFYANKDPRVKCFIFDSPFSNFKQMVKELVKQKAPIPDFVVSGALKMIRKTVLKKADFDIDALKPAKFVDKLKLPALFGAAKDDTLVSAQHTRDLFNAYGGLKELMIFDGDHNSKRPDIWKKKVQEFIQIHLLEDKSDNRERLRPFKMYFSSQQNQEETMFINLEKETAAHLSSHYLPKPLKQTSASAQQEMKLSWLENSTSLPSQTSASCLGLKDNEISIDTQIDSTLNATSNSTSLSELAQNNGTRYRRAATYSIGVRDSYESSKLAAKGCLSPPDFHKTIRDSNTGLENMSSPSVHSGDLSLGSQSRTQSEDIVESPTRPPSFHKHSATLKDISSFGLNGSSDMANWANNKGTNAKDLQALSPKPLMGDHQFSVSTLDLDKSPDFKRVSSGNYASYQPARTSQTENIFHKKNVSNIPRTSGIPSLQIEDSSPANLATKTSAGHVQNKKSMMLKVKLNLDTPIISATAQTARTSMADLLARNLYQERNSETNKGRESVEFTSKAGPSAARMNC